MDFNSIYARYVIWSGKDNMYVGPNSEMWRVALRQDAQRFTKQKAIEYIERENDDSFLIEDAT